MVTWGPWSPVTDHSPRSGRSEWSRTGAWRRYTTGRAYPTLEWSPAGWAGAASRRSPTPASRRQPQPAAAINPIIYGEVSIGFQRVEGLDAALPEELRRESLPWDVAFLAGKAFLGYRRRGGTRATPLPDFFIGAHAAVRGVTLLTRDARRSRTYFPALSVVAPEE